MPIKEMIAAKVTQELYQAMSSPYFLRLSNVLWRVLNEFQAVRFGVAAELKEFEARLAAQERSLDLMQAKLKAMEDRLDAAAPAKKGTKA